MTCEKRLKRLSMTMNVTDNVVHSLSLRASGGQQQLGANALRTLRESRPLLKPPQKPINRLSQQLTPPGNEALEALNVV
jgi:hypothetical protein